MIALGIDPGTKVVGYGVIESTGSRLIHLDNGGIYTRPQDGLPERLRVIYGGLKEIIEEFRPGVLSVESLFYSKNALSALKLGHARGVAILAGANAGIEVFEYTPTEIKSAVVGYGRADKLQVQQMVKILLKLPEAPMPDAADALAAAICHLNTNRTKKRLTADRNFKET